MLGHWVALDAGRISRYQIIAPTTWNFSPRDGQACPAHWKKHWKG
jgi:hydrogenase large subunit